MLGVNWIDLIIILLVITAVVRGLRVNFWSQLFTIVGFFSGLFLFGWLSSRVLSFIQDPATFTLINGNVVLIVSAFLAILGNTLGYRVHVVLVRGRRMRLVEPGLAIFLSVASMLTAVWLIAAVISRLPFVGFSNSTSDALIVQTLNRNLPPTPKFFSLIGRHVDINNAPRVVTKSDAKSVSIVPPFLPDANSAAASAENSIVRITSFGCGGIVSGSGFVVGQNLIATNAHVIAGVPRPIVKHNDNSYEGIPVFFDANLDFAVMRVQNLDAKPIELDTRDVAPSTTVAVLGYPDGNYQAAPGVVLDKVVAEIRSIYDIGVIGRDIYGVQMDIHPGSSGGPIVLADGRLAGIVFSRASEVDNYGFALTSKSIEGPINQAAKTKRRVGTGVCQ